MARINEYPTLLTSEARTLIMEAIKGREGRFSKEFIDATVNSVPYPKMDGLSFHALDNGGIAFRLPLPDGVERCVHVRMFPQVGSTSFLSFDYRMECSGQPSSRFFHSLCFDHVFRFYDEALNPASIPVILDAIEECLREDEVGAIKMSVRTRRFLLMDGFREIVADAILAAMKKTKAPSYEQAKLLFRNACALLSWQDPYQSGIETLYRKGFPLAAQVLLDDAKKHGLPYRASAFLYLPEEAREAYLHGVRVLARKLPKAFSMEAARVFLGDADGKDEILSLFISCGKKSTTLEFSPQNTVYSGSNPKEEKQTTHQEEDIS